MKDSSLHIGMRYRNGPNSYMTVVGYIDRPAIVLRDLMTGEKSTVIIDSPMHRNMEEIEDSAALEIAELKIIAG